MLLIAALRLYLLQYANIFIQKVKGFWLFVANLQT